jgi:hypothetical protein
MSGVRVPLRPLVIVSLIVGTDGAATQLDTHPVADVGSWLGFKAERAEAVASLGGTNIVDHGARVAASGARRCHGEARGAPPMVAYVES